MRVLQLIDSLRAGGAERMAVSYANALAERIDASFLCCTRLEGILKPQLSPEVGYLFLKKKFSLDPRAFKKLRDFVIENQIDLVQAHGTSYFLAVLLKRSLPRLRLIWHEHSGRASEEGYSRPLRIASRYFDAVLSVNSSPERISALLDVKAVMYARNFLASLDSSASAQVKLMGGEGFKLICVANLREPKDHLNLLQAFKILRDENSKVSLHLVGKDYEDSYSMQLKEFIARHGLEEKVHFYGVRTDVESLLPQADLGVLSSSSEGLPMALLEYGRAGLPVVCTRVGECPAVVGAYAVVVPSEDSKAMAEAIVAYLKDENRRRKDAAAFQDKVLREYSEQAVLKEVLQLFSEVLSSKRTLR